VSNVIQRLYEQGQSIWCDNISRRMIETGELQSLIDLGVVGVTSNPTIFMKAITGGTTYDNLLSKLLAKTQERMDVYEGLVLPDIADAADILRPVYERTKGVNGYVSLEVNPKLAYDTDGTVNEARRLFGTLKKPNVLIKVPATDEGMPAIETLIAEGINVNVTLIFSLAMYEKTMAAYMAGLRRLETGGGDLSKVASVASFFVSRVDTLVDKLLEEKRAGGAKVDHLLGRAAAANAKLAYARFEEVFGASGEFKELAGKGARAQRPVWASTSTKNPDYPDTKYVDELVGPNTVNTIPPSTIEAALDHGRSETTIRDDLEGARQLFAELGQIGIDIDAVTDKLRVDGVDAFAKSFEELLANLEQKQKQLRATV
jgi:transaldolase